MSACPFCERIRNGACEGVDFSREVVWFAPLNPVTQGHMLFVPARHTLHPHANAVGRAMASAAEWARRYGKGDFNLITSSGPAATQTVEHIHVHLVPRREGDGLHLPWTGQVSA